MHLLVPGEHDLTSLHASIFLSSIISCDDCYMFPVVIDTVLIVRMIEIGGVEIYLVFIK